MKIRVKNRDYCCHTVSLTDGTLGLCSHEERCILIASGQSKRAYARTVLHEVLHAISFEYNFELTHKIIDPLEKALLDFLIDNPKLIKKLSQMGKKRE